MAKSLGLKKRPWIMILGDKRKNGEKSWSEKTTKEKLDMVFVVVAIVGFTLGAVVNYKLLTKK
jgi:hypothetical protein